MVFKHQAPNLDREPTLEVCAMVRRTIASLINALPVAPGTSARFLVSMLALITMVVASHNAGAENLSLLLNGKSIHTNKSETTDYNESNWGFGLQYEFVKPFQSWIPFVAASGFKDSLNQPSYYAGGGYMRRLVLSRQLNYLHADAGLIGFLMSRQDYKSGQPFLGALPAFSLGTRDVAVNITYIPKVHPKMAELWFFQLKVAASSFKF